MYWSKEERDHRAILRKALAAPEVGIAEGPLAGPILHLRARGKTARFSAGVLLFFLIIAVVAGLIFSLGLPFWQQYVDGKRQTLIDAISATDQALLTLDVERETQRTKLVSALLQVGDRQALPGSERMWFIGALALSPHTALIYGSDGTVIRWTRAGGPEPKLDLPGSEGMYFNGALALDPDTALIYGSHGTVIRWTRAGGPDQRMDLPGSERVHFTGALALDPDTALIYGTGGTVIRWTRAGGPEPKLALPGSKSVTFFGALALDPDTALIFGSDGTVIRWTRAGGQDQRLVLPGSETVEFRGAPALAPDTALIFGTQGTMTRWTRAGGPDPRIDLPGSKGLWFFGALAVEADTALIYGSGRTMVRWTRAGGPEPKLALPGSESVTFFGALALGPDTALIFGNDGTVVRISNVHSDLAANLVLQAVAPQSPDPASGADPSPETGVLVAADPLTSFITTLPVEIRNLPAIDTIAKAVRGIEDRRKAYETSKAIAAEALLKLDESGLPSI